MDTPPQLAEISALDLARQLEAGAAIQLLDVRAPQRLASGRVDLGPAELFHNLPNSQLFQLADPAAAGLSRELPVVTVCGHGHSSLQAQQFLAGHGYTGASLAGGMSGWMQLLVPRELPAPPGFDRLVQFDRVGKGALGYLLISGGAALAIDVPRSTQPFLDAAAASGARIAAVAETHVHADYISGGPGLAAALGVPYYLHPADAVYPYDGTPGRLDFTPLADGQELAVGPGRLNVVHTPGHTEGSVCFVAGDAAAFTGDFIFIASVGRPDLAGQAEAWGRQLQASIELASATWPAGLSVYPAHYASPTERNANRSIGRTFSELLAANPALRLDSAAFMNWVLSRAAAPPPAYRRIKALNLGLESAGAAEVEELEGGKNECAVG